MADPPNVDIFHRAQEIRRELYDALTVVDLTKIKTVLRKWNASLYEVAETPNFLFHILDSDYYLSELHIDTPRLHDVDDLRLATVLKARHELL